MREDPAVRGGQRGGEASLRSQKVSAAQLQVYLKGMDYPANRQKIINHAKSLNAPDNVMQFLNRLPERQYTRPTEIEQEFGKMK